MISPIHSNWAYGSVRSDHTFNGGGGTSNVGDVDAREHYNLVTATMGWFVPRTWQNLFKSISRVNVAIRAVTSLSETVYPAKKIRLVILL